jgi:uncharacterized membrane protein
MGDAMLRPWTLALLAAACGMTTGIARAADGFEVCNRTTLTVVFAKATNITTSADRKKGKPYVITSEGWFTLAPGSCAMAWSGPLQYRYYDLYAEAKASNRKWSGDRPICVENGNFKMTHDLCPPSKNRRMFVEVDTGDSRSYTHDFK